MIRIFAVATLVAGLCSTGNVFANDGKQLYDDFRCTGCHGLDGKGTGANVKGLKPRVGIAQPRLWQLPLHSGHRPDNHERLL